MESQQSAPRNRDDNGAALISAMLILLLMAAVTAGFTALVITDTRVRSLDSTRTQSFYAAHAGLEKLTSDLGDLFSANFAPTGAQIDALMATPPNIGVTWQQPDGTNGYRITYPAAGGNPVATVSTVSSGPFQGLVGLATPYTVTVTGRLPDLSESSLTRTLQTVAIPVFQFGIFSENDLSFFPGPNFNFGGRVHSNASIFLATEATTPGLTLSDRVTAVNEVIRMTLSNGAGTTVNGYNGFVRAITAPGAFRNLEVNEGSLEGGLGSALNATWSNTSTGTYNHNIMNGLTGARRLDLPIVAFGAGPIDLIRRPVVGENANVRNERFYSLASLRILLSDTAADITALPGVTATAPIELGQLVPAGYNVSDTAAQPRPRFGRSPAPGAGILVPQNTPLMGGFIKIEKQTVPGTWVDVTLEILSLGINSPQLHSSAVGAMTYNSGAPGAIACRDHTPNAIIRLQRPWDVGGAQANGCWSLAEAMEDSSTASRRYSPLSLYDPREGTQRDVAPANMQLGGIMYFVELDARNLARWFRGQILAANCPIACTGGNSLNVNGYTVYFSDRRGNRNGLVETGEYGYEDIVNPVTGAPNGGVPETGEDFNGNGTLQVYGGAARVPYGVLNWPAMAAGPLTAAATPLTQVTGANAIEQARRNTPIFFRRALKLTRGADLVAAAPGLIGLTVASENPVYIQGNWNGNGTFDGAHVATSVLADAVTLLSNNWNDRNSFVNPHAVANRDAVTSWYRVAIIAGKGINFNRPLGTAKDFGTDGGAHNFLRYIEDWANQTLNYRGSIASLFYSRQAIGTYKCCTLVYSPPTRGYNFDVEFLAPALLPPRTPMFRDVNITGFAHLIRPQ